jgi:hypothetical protein
MTLNHDPLCALMKQESCHGIGGADFGHYLDQPTCRNCGKKCDCDRVAELREQIAQEIEKKLIPNARDLGLGIEVFNDGLGLAARITRNG